MANEKRKKMTEREKKERAKIRRELQEKGVLSAPKKPLNRKKFIEEAKALLHAENNGRDFDRYLIWALVEMLGHRDRDFHPDGEAVGAAKIVHLAKARQRFEQEQQAQGRTEWTVGEMLDAVIDIYEA